MVSTFQLTRTVKLCLTHQISPMTQIFGIQIGDICGICGSLPPHSHAAPRTLRFRPFRPFGIREAFHPKAALRLRRSATLACGTRLPDSYNDCMTTTEEAAQAIDRHQNRRPSDDEIRQFSPFPLGLPGQNIKFFAKSQSGMWLLKFCHNDFDRVPEVCEREVMTSLFGLLLGVPTVEAWVVPTSKLATNPVQHIREWDLIQDRFVLMRYIDQEPAGSFGRESDGRSVAGQVAG